MVKSKKLSRGSLAVLLLALMLALSMVVGITGAWFTDYQKAGQAKDDITFGKVNISGTTSAVTKAEGVDLLHVLPGDSWSLSASTSAALADVDMWVQIIVSTEFKIGGNTYTELYDKAGEGKQSVITYNALHMIANQAGWTLEDETNGIYSVTAAAGVANFEGGLSFIGDKMGNVVYDASGNAITLNDAGADENPATVTGSLEVKLTVKAVQKKGLATAAAAKDVLGAIVVA